MNDANQSAEVSPIPTPSSSRVAAPAAVQSWSYWLKKFLICNPFYLASAALLLFGLYRVSIDPNFLPEETAQLRFNFTSLQLYELLLVGTAWMLARRLIWYDAKLLVTMENLLVLVPFMLVSQAALIHPRTVWIFCGAAAVFAVTRSALAQRGVTALRFPPRLALVGLVVLAVNAAWPVIYRHLHESKVGTKIESGAAYGVHELGWLALLPALIALANLLPSRRADGKSPVPGRRFPLGLVALWIAGSAVHLYSLGYVYDFDLHREWLAPALWALAWTVYFRLPDYVEGLGPITHKSTLALPLLVTLVAANEAGSNVVFALNLINLFAFAAFSWQERGNKLAQHLALVALAAVIAATPAPLCSYFTGWFNRGDLVSLAGLAYVMIAILRTSNPKITILGALAAAAAAGALRDRYGDAGPWAAQGGFVFFLLHSLRWRDYEHRGAAAIRVLAAMGWLLHAVVWVRYDAAAWHPFIPAAAVLVVCGLRGWIFLRWTPYVAPLAALGVALCGPLNSLVTKAQTAPIGVLALGGSLLLFTLGTATALTKHRWHRGDTN